MYRYTKRTAQVIQYNGEQTTATLVASFEGCGLHLKVELTKIKRESNEVENWFRLHCREDFVGNFAQANPAATLKEGADHWPDLARLELHIGQESWTYSKPKTVHELEERLGNLTIEDAAAVAE